MKEVVIITGASRGIGREIAKVFAKTGYCVVANYNRSENDAIKLKEDLIQEGIEIDIKKADVSKREEAERLVKETINKYGKVDILVNNAGISEYKLFTEETDEDWNRVINNNLYSSFAMSQAVIPNMVHNKKGCIINISSIWGVIGGSYEVLYSIAKSGMNGMTKALAKELGPSNIRVNAIAPGIIKTDMIKEFDENELEAIKGQIPLERIGNVEDIAKCAKWLAEDRYVTGQIISVNGGWSI